MVDEQPEPVEGPSPELLVADGEELVEQPFNRLVAARKLLAYNYDGFWVPMDTAKDKAKLDDLYASGKPPWFVWNGGGESIHR